jgi:hypothetical protein
MRRRVTARTYPIRSTRQSNICGRQHGSAPQRSAAGNTALHARRGGQAARRSASRSRSAITAPGLTARSAEIRSSRSASSRSMLTTIRSLASGPRLPDARFHDGSRRRAHLCIATNASVAANTPARLLTPRGRRPRSRWRTTAFRPGCATELATALATWRSPRPGGSLVTAGCWYRLRPSVGGAPSGAHALPRTHERRRAITDAPYRR